MISTSIVWPISSDSEADTVGATGDWTVGSTNSDVGVIMKLETLMLSLSPDETP